MSASAPAPRLDPASADRPPEGTEYYRDFWKDYSARLGRRPRITAEAQEALFSEVHSSLLAEEFRKASGRLVANLGCGKGTHSVPMERRGFRVVNADFSVEALELTRAYYRRQHMKPLLVRCDLAHLPFKAESFDVVMNFGVMEHFHDIRTPYAEMARSLKRGGVFHSEIVTKRFSLLSIEVFLSALLYTFYNLFRLRLSKIRGISRTAHMGEAFFENSYTLDEYRAAIADCGIRDIRSFGVRPFLMMEMPRGMDRLYSMVLKALVPVWRGITLSGWALTKRICPVWLVYGRK